MANKIEHLIFPKSLKLVWQNKNDKKRPRYTVGRLSVHEDGLSLTYLTETEEFQKAKKGGFEGYPAFTDLNKVYENVEDVFKRRLLSRKRTDFKEYLKSYGLEQFPEISDIELLAYTGAKLPTDGFSMVHSFEDANPPFEFVCDVAGVRFRLDEKIREKIQVGDQVKFERELNNKFDPNAIKILVRDIHIGYVNKAQTDLIQKFLDSYSVSAQINKINGTKEIPIIYIFVEVKE